MFCNYTKQEFWILYQRGLYDVLYKVIDGSELIEPIIHKNGLREYEGFEFNKELYNGYGAYTTYDLNVAVETCKQMKEPIIVAYAIKKNKYTDFIVFDNNIREKMKDFSWMSLTPKEMIEKLVKPEQIGLIDKYVKNCQDIPQEYRSKGVDYFSTMPPKGGKQAKILCEALNVSNRKRKTGFFIEEDILKTRIRGYVFDGHKNKKAVVVRDFGSIMPVQYSRDCGQTWVNNEALDDEDTYNQLMLNSVFPIFEYGSEYTNHDSFHHCSIHGFSKVSGVHGNNYIGARTHKRLFPVDIEGFLPFPTVFIPLSKEIRFNLGKYEFYLTKRENDEKYKLYLKGETIISYDFFCIMIKQICPEKPFYKENLLQDFIGNGY